MKPAKNKSRTQLIIIYLLTLTVFSGCGVEYKFNRAKNLEKDGRYEESIKIYKEIADRYPLNVHVPESLYCAGRIYQQKLKNYTQSQDLFSELLNRFPAADKWKELAVLGIFNSPNYFPLFDENLWVEGDSQSYGKNMRVERNCKKISGQKYLISNKYYAGEKIVTTVSRYYTKKDYKLHEFNSADDKESTILLDFPFYKGKTWTTLRDGQKTRFTIVDSSVSVKVHAGKFDNCLKIREENLSFPSAYKYKYYAPELGYILTTVASVKEPAERRHSELLSSKVIPE